ncbi:MAG: VWA domain-containing protein [Dehalococcoidia bacterium]|nr:VWA domain-containing protein [Dehalococcoidia bacterium]
MSFDWPAALLFLLLIPVAGIAYIMMQRRRGRYAVRFTNLDLLANIVEGAPAWRRHVPAVVYLGALAALLLALARPHVDQQVPKDGTVVLVTDISGSMNATDIQPTRLAAAQSAAEALVRQLPGGFRVAVMSFSNVVQVRLTPTTDKRAVEQALGAMVPNGGTAMGDAILRALDLIAADEQAQTKAAPSTGAGTPTPTPTPAAGGSGQPARPKAVIVLLSDGASNTGADPIEAATQAKDANVPIYTIALGTPDGVAEVRDNLGRLRRVAVPPDPGTLQSVSETTGAESFDAPSASQLESIYASLGEKIGHDTKQRDVTPAFVGAGVALILLGGVSSLFWFNRFP